MPDPAHESTGVNYAKKDASAERLWLTQRTKANPWDQQRASSDEDQPSGQPPADGSSEANAGFIKTPMISQQDTLALDASRETPLENPFEALIEHQRNQRP